VLATDIELGVFGDIRLDRRGLSFLLAMVKHQTVCLRRLAGVLRSPTLALTRFLENFRVKVETIVEGWSDATSVACAGRHVLAIQDTSEINFKTTPDNRRGLGKIGKGSGHGLLLHAMIGVDAQTGGLLGLVAGRIWTRSDRVKTPHCKRRLADKESERWLSTSEAAKDVLAQADMVTEVSDRESDLYVKWARVPQPGFHLLGRAMHDRPIVEGGGTLSTAPLTLAGDAYIELRERPGREARKAHVMARFGQVTLKRPRHTTEKGLPRTVKVTLVEVSEVDAPPGVEPILWRLLTTHIVANAIMAWTIVSWYRLRWTIEQFFRTLKQQGLDVENSQVETAERLMKLVAIAARAAAMIMQLVHARDGKSEQDAAIAFTPVEIKVLEALVPTLEGKTILQRNPHPPKTLAWAAWVIAKLGGWNGYPKSRPPGPITFRHGLQYFKAIVKGWELKHV
jgi:hypothetical protein